TALPVRSPGPDRGVAARTVRAALRDRRRSDLGPDPGRAAVLRRRDPDRDGVRPAARGARPARRRAGDAVDPARRGGLPAVRRPGPWPPWGSTEGRCVGVIISRRTLLVGGLAASLGLTGCAGATESPEQTARLLPSGAPLPDRFTR